MSKTIISGTLADKCMVNKWPGALKVESYDSFILSGEVHSDECGGELYPQHNMKIGQTKSMANAYRLS